MCFLCFCSLCFVFYYYYYFAFAPCHHCCCCLLCYVTPRLTLQLFGMVHRSLLCINVAWCGVSPSPYTPTTCCGVSSFTLHYYYLLWCITCALSCHLLLVVVCHPLLCTTIFVVFHSSLCANAACCGALSFALCCYYLLWCVIPHFTLLLIMVCHLCFALLLLFTMVCHPSPCPTTACCGASPSPYAIVDHCGLSFLTLR